MDGAQRTVDDPRRIAAALLDWYARAGVTAMVREPGAPSDPPPLAPSAAPVPPPPAAAPYPVARRAEGGAAAARAAAAAATTLALLRQALERFDGCALKQTATRLCFADGTEGAPLMLIGEAPGAEEDRQGLPFVGQSGQLLDRMLAAVGLDRRRNVWITNCIFWRPPGNRPPTTAEIAACLPFVERQVELLAPRLILFVGGIAAKAMLDTDDGVTRLRGRALRYRTPSGVEIPARATFHPAYLLRQPLQKRFVWRDLLQVQADLEALGVVP